MTRDTPAGPEERPAARPRGALGRALIAFLALPETLPPSRRMAATASS